jgi:hypothetical protein
MPHSQSQAAAPSSATSKALSDNETLRKALAGQHGLLPGIALVEDQLKVARRAAPEEAPFPLTPAEARLHHEASASAYSHSLEMVSSNFLRELHAKLGQAPGAPGAENRTAADLEAENALLADALFGKYGVTSGADVIEKCLATATRADHLDSPFPLTAAQGALWHRAQQSAYVYVLEMLCTDRLKSLAGQFPLPADPAPAADEEPAPAPGM